MRRVPWGTEDDYEATGVLGDGSYSTVYAGINVRDNNTPIVLKLLNEIKDYRIEREINILNQLRDHPNIVTLVDATKNPESGISTLVFDYMNHTSFGDLQRSLKLEDLKWYTFKLLDALRYANEFGVMHRDLKPNNLLFSIEPKDLRIIDWGLATWYDPYKKHAPSVATVDYRSPEISLDFVYYDQRVDIWNAGCIFGEMMFRTHRSMMEGEDEEENLNEAAKFLGSDGLYIMARKYWLGMNPDWVDFIGYKEKGGFLKLMNETNSDLVTDQGVDLLEKMLTWDFQDRITAKDALEHEFFDSVRDKMPKFEPKRDIEKLKRAPPKPLTFD